MFNNAGKYSGSFTAVYKPSITSPTAGQIVESITPTITSSAFSKYGYITHASTDWQVSDRIDFTTIRWQSLADSTNKTSITTSNLGGGDRYVRVRYRSSDGNVSEWSDGVYFTSPWASGSDSTLTDSTNMDVNASTTVTVQPGTYRVTLWGAAGGRGANGASGGAGGSVRKDVTYTTATNVSITIGTGGQGGNGACHENPCSTALGGSPGGGNGASSSDWRGGGGGGYSSALGMTAGGGGGGSAGGGYATGGGQDPSQGNNSGAGYGGGGCAGPGSGVPGSSGSSGGGGGGGSHQTDNFQAACQSGNGGANSGSFSVQYAASGSTVGNSYTSSAYGRTFGQGNGASGGARIQRLESQVQPSVGFTNNLPTTSTSTAGGSANFSVTATDTANTDSTVAYQWYLSTNGGSSYSPIAGAITSTLSRYNPFYYSDNGHKIYCRATVTNSIGTDSANSEICTLTVNRNYDCNSTTVSGSVLLSQSGLKSQAPAGGVIDWGTWSPGFSDVCYIEGYTDTFNAGGRCNFCISDGQQQGWNLGLELRITRSTDGTRRHWGSQTLDSSGCGSSGSRTYGMSANGGGWTPETDGTPTIRLVQVADSTSCKGGVGGDIGAEQYTNCILHYLYRRRTYYYETRPT